jgi:hypothetical protein
MRRGAGAGRGGGRGAGFRARGGYAYGPVPPVVPADETAALQRRVADLEAALADLRSRMPGPKPDAAAGA